MAAPAIGQDEQQLKRRAMRRLAIALAVIAVAIAALTLLDRYNAAVKKPEPIPSQALPPPAESSPSAQPPALSPEVRHERPPPPPPVVSNEPVVPAERPSFAPRTSKEAHEPEGSVTERKAAPGGTISEAPRTTPEAQAAAKPPALPPSLAESAPKGFLVQVGVFTTPENADKLQAKLAERNIPSYVETRVVVGPFKDRAEAESVNQQLKQMGLQGVVVAPH